MSAHISTDPVDSEENGAVPADAGDKSETEKSVMEQAPEKHEPDEHDPPQKLSRFRQIYQRYRAKGKWFVVGFFVFYLIRDTLLYIILPWYLAKGGMSLFDWLFDN